MKPFFPYSSIKTGLYTRGAEYMYFKTGEEYIGIYHILPNGQYWSGDKPTDDNSMLLVPLINYSSEMVKKYNNISNKKTFNYINPIPYRPILMDNDYEVGNFERIFVQRKNNPKTTIIEIDAEQALKINDDNKQGINKSLWNYIMITWYISGPISEVLNAKAVAEAEKNFKGISKYLTNYLEFVK